MVLTSVGHGAEDDMPSEQEHNEDESMPPGFRHLTQSEFDKLKQALSKMAPRALTEAEQDRVRQRKEEWRKHMEEGRTRMHTYRSSLISESASLKREPAETRQALEKERKNFLLMVAIVALIPTLILFYSMLRGAPHW